MFIWTLFRELWCSKSFLCLVGHTAGNFSEITMFFLFFGTPFGKLWILPCLLGHPFGNFCQYHVYLDTLLEFLVTTMFSMFIGTSCRELWCMVISPYIHHIYRNFLTCGDYKGFNLLLDTL